MVHSFHQDSVSVSGDFGIWRDAVCDALIDLDFKMTQDAPFSGNLRRRTFRDTRIIDVCASGHSVARDNSRIRRSSDDFVLLSRMIDGSATLIQNGREANLQPGDFAIYDTTIPYQFFLASSFKMTVMRIERDRFGHLVRDLGDATARRVSGSSGTGRIASMLIGELSNELEAIGDMTGRQMQDTMLGMVSAALNEIRNGPSVPSSEPRYQLAQRALRLVEDQLGNDELSCEFVAARLGVSCRYLRKVFADRGRSLSDIIWNRRLEEAHRQLVSKCGVQRSVTSIAFDCGFKDSAHFSRAFRARFGISPRDFRRSS